MHKSITEKWKKEIYAWADGLDIQQMVPVEKGGLGGWVPFDGDWLKLPTYYDYRIKP